MILKFGTIATMAACVAVLAWPRASYAQASQAFQVAEGQLELAELSPDKRAEVEARMGQGGQKVHEILQTILLNSIKLKHPANRIVALDFGRGIAIIETSNNQMQAINFDTRTLAVKS